VNTARPVVVKSSALVLDRRSNHMQDGGMTAIRTARERARAELTREIKDEARSQLAAEGPQRLSLRSVARELGMVSSALYRYFPSKDDLLTALIIDAYDSLGAAAERAAAAADPDDRPARWRATCRAVRRWAKGRPHEYALIYGSPIPGYSAPQDTVVPASRVPLVLVGLVRESWDAGTLTIHDDVLPSAVDAQATQLAAAIAPELPGAVLTRAVVAWTQLFGMISFELFGQLVGSFDPSDAFFDHAVEQMVEYVGLH